MSQYLNNLKLWAKGFRWLWTKRKMNEDLNAGLRRAVQQGYDRQAVLKVQRDEFIVYAKGWGPWTFMLLLYWWDHGTRVLMGGSCVSWSRWFYLHRRTYGSSNLVTRLLNKLDRDHGRDSGDPLWGTTDTEWAGVGALVFWSGIIALIAYWLV